MELFKLHLSFLGWILLSVITLSKNSVVLIKYFIPTTHTAPINIDNIQNITLAITCERLAKITTAVINSNVPAPSKIS